MEELIQILLIRLWPEKCRPVLCELSYSSALRPLAKIVRKGQQIANSATLNHQANDAPFSIAKNTSLTMPEAKARRHNLFDGYSNCTYG